MLTHPFKDKIDVTEFSTDSHGIITTIERFHQHVASLAEKYHKTYDRDKFKGDSLELLVEYMLITMGADNRIGIYDYEPVTHGDTGVDGIGRGENGFPATVQVKYRTPDYVLTGNEDHLLNFSSASWGRYLVPVDSINNMLIITTGKEVHYYTLNEMFQNKVRVLNMQDLKTLLNDRLEWWHHFFNTIREDQIKEDPLANPPVVLRKHQNNAVQSWKDYEEDRGKIICPTGTGKTYIQAEIIYEMIRKNPTAVVQINSPRILLCWQLLEQVMKYLISKGVTNTIYLNYNSGNWDEDEYVKTIREKGVFPNKVESTTFVEAVQQQHDKAKEASAPLVIVSTYHSACKLATSGIIPDIMFHDEAHNLVSEEFSEVTNLPAKQHLFFTATERETSSEESYGMNNPERFGNTIFEVSPRSMIEAGEMLSPFIHIVRPAIIYDITKIDNDYEALFKSVANSFLAHDAKIKADSHNPDSIAAKMLVTLRGQEELRQIFETKTIARFRIEHPEVHLGGLSSEFGVVWDDNFVRAPVSSKNKQEMMDRFKALTSDEKAIVFHVDMIGEGIDVPGITGVMLFRNLQAGKLYQNIGRACRLHPIDRELIYGGEVSIEDKAPWVKPNAWVVLPDIFATSPDTVKDTKDLVFALRKEYGFQLRTNVFIQQDRGLFEPDPIKTVNPQSGEKKENSGLNEFENNFEDIIDVLERDVASQMRRKRTVSENLVTRALKDVEVPTAIEESFPEHFLANLLFVYEKTYCEDFSWRDVPEDLQRLFEDNMMGIITWEEACAIIETNFKPSTAPYKELMNYLHLNREAVAEAVRSNDKEVIDMAKACLSSTVAKKKFGEVFTPISLVDEMLDKLPVELWLDPTLTWLDPAMGSGNFLIRVSDRLMEGLAAAIPDEADRRKHIMEQMVYGVELQPKNVMIASMFLDPESQYETHLACADSLKFDFWDMKFDVVVGNPPYQKEDGGHSRSSKPIYHTFVYKSQELSARYVLMITPSRWMIGGKGLSGFRNDMMKDRRVKLIVDDSSSSGIFTSVDIAGGVSYFLWDAEYYGPCNFNGVERYLDEEDIIVRENEALSILKKVKKSSQIWIGSSASPRKPYGLDGEAEEVANSGVPCWHKQSIGLRMISPDDVKDPRGDVNTWRVLVPYAPIAGQTDFSKPISFFNDKNVIIAKPGEYCTETFIILKSCSTEEEAKNFLSYLKTRFFRFMLRMRTISQHITRENYMWVPDLEDYSKEWNDRELYTHFNLTQEEITLIENTIV